MPTRTGRIHLDARMTTVYSWGAMRIRVFSDLHLDFGPVDVPAVAADVVVLAGDIHTGDAGVAWARRTFGDLPIVYVLGNHEYYGHTLPDHAAHMTALGALAGVHVLEQSEIEVGGVTFLGCTLWTDMALLGSAHQAASSLRRGMADYRTIHLTPGADPLLVGETSARPLQPTDTIRLHRRALAWLDAALRRHAGRPTVVVTHHAPSPRSLGAHDRGLHAAAYASRLDAFVAHSGARLWIHGHTHQRRDYWLASTRVVCNARGYADRPLAEFDPACVVEVE